MNLHQRFFIGVVVISTLTGMITMYSCRLTAISYPFNATPIGVRKLVQFGNFYTTKSPSARFAGYV